MKSGKKVASGRGLKRTLEFASWFNKDSQNKHSMLSTPPPTLAKWLVFKLNVNFFL